MAWSNIHPDAPLDDQGRPVHPEKGYTICGYEKTDATAKNGGKRHDIPYCLQSAGWGSDRNTGHCTKHNGGSPGAPEGWQNGNARHLLYSKRMDDDDREVFDAVVKDPDGNLLNIDDMADMLKNTVAWEYTRLVRAVELIPDAELVETYQCPDCGTKGRDPGPHGPHTFQVGPGEFRQCETTTWERVDAYVKFGDKAIERKESRLANLIATYKKVAEGTDVNIDGSMDHTHKGDPDEPVEVNITHAGVDLPDDETVDHDRGEEDTDE